MNNIPEKYKGLKSMCKCLIDLQEKTITPNLIKNYEKLVSLLKTKTFFGVSFLNCQLNIQPLKSKKNAAKS